MEVLDRIKVWNEPLTSLHISNAIAGKKKVDEQIKRRKSFRIYPPMMTQHVNVLRSATPMKPFLDDHKVRGFDWLKWDSSCWSFSWTWTKSHLAWNMIHLQADERRTGSWGPRMLWQPLDTRWLPADCSSCLEKKGKRLGVHSHSRDSMRVYLG